MPKSIKQLIRRDIDTYAPEWFDRQPVLLGDYTATVQTGTPGILYARQFNGKVIQVHNTANVPPTFDLHVIVGRKKSLPTTWQIIEVRETYLTPAGGGQIGYHHEQHEFPNGDTIWSDRKQILPLTVLVQDAAGFVVQVFGSVVHTATGIHKIATQLVDLSSYVVTVGAKFVSIETDDEGTLSVHDGVVFGSPLLATDADIPVPAPGKYLIAFVLFYEGQVELADDDIRVPFPLGVIGKDSGLQIDEAAADTPLDADKFGFWDVVDSVLKSITWENLKALLDTLYSAVTHTHFNDDEGTPENITTGSPSVGASEYAARRDHVHHLENPDASTASHLHGLTRWDSAGGSAFEYPDIVEYIDSVSLNGLEEDPLLYSLSGDRTQLVFDSATTAGDKIISRYVLAIINSQAASLDALASFSLLSSGLLLEEDFASIADWDNEGTWVSAADLRISAFPIPRVMLAPGIGTPDSAGIRETHMVDMGEGTYYLFHDGWDGTDGGWVCHLSKSTDYGKTWTRLGVQVGIAKGHTTGDWAARAYGFVHKVGATYYLTVVDAHQIVSGVPTPPFEESIYTSSSLEGPWTYVSRGAVNGAGGSYDEVTATGGSVVLDASTYYRFFTALDGGTDVSIGMATSSNPDGPWTDMGKRTMVSENDPENPKVFWSAFLDRWIMLTNQITAEIDPAGSTTSNRAHVGTSLTDWSAADVFDFMWARLKGHSGTQASNIDTTAGDVVGYASPLYLEDGTPSFDGDMIPFTYDGYPTDGNHKGRKVLAGVLEPSLNSLYYTGTTQKIIQRTLTNADFVAEFSIRLTAQTDVNAQLAFLYRRASVVGATQNGYQFAFIPAPAANSGISFGKYVSGTFTQIAVNNNLDMVLGTQYRIRIEVSGSSHKLYANDVLIIGSSDSTFSTGATVAFNGFQSTGYLWGFHMRKSNTITITGAPSAVRLHAPGGIYVKEHQTAITHTHYPMRALSLGGTFAEFPDGVYGGDVYEYSE